MRGRLLATLVVGGLVAMAAFASACGDDSSPGGSDSDADTPAAGADQSTVRAIEEGDDPRTGWKFDPASISVAAGTEIVFTNDGAEVHTATADDGSFDTGTLSSGGTASVTFDEPGTFTYKCSLHPWMTGEVVVTGG